MGSPSTNKGLTTNSNGADSDAELTYMDEPKSWRFSSVSIEWRKWRLDSRSGPQAADGEGEVEDRLKILMKARTLRPSNDQAHQNRWTLASTRGFTVGHQRLAEFLLSALHLPAKSSRILVGAVWSRCGIICPLGLSTPLPSLSLRTHLLLPFLLPPSHS